MSDMDGGPDPANPYDDVLASQDRQRISGAIITAPANPDAAGRANRLARSFGVPQDTVLRNLADFETQQQARQARALTDQHPQVGPWLADPSHAAVARDDLDNVARNAAAWGQAAGAAVAAAPPTAPASRASYLGTSFLSGLHGVIGAVAGLVDQLNPFTTSVKDLNALTANDPAARDRLVNHPSAWIAPTTFLSRSARSEGDKSRNIMANQSPANQAQFGSLTYKTLDPSKAAYLSPTRVAGDVVQSLPTAAVLAATAFLTRGASLRAQAAATAAGATEAEAAAVGVKAAQTMATRVGAGGMGAVGYQQQQDEVRSQIEAMSFDQLAASPEYLALRRSGLDPESARMSLASSAGQRAGLGAGVVGALTSVAGGPLLGKIFGEGGAVLPRVAKGFGTEAVQNAAMAGGQQVAGNAAMQEADPHRKLTDGVVETMLQGGVVGGVSGGVMAGLVRRAVHGQAQIDNGRQSANLLDRAMTAAADSKVRVRDDDAFQKFVDIHTRGTPIENIYVPASRCSQYFLHDRSWSA